VQRLPEQTELRGLAVAERYRKAQNVGVVLRVGGGRWIDGVLYPLTIQPGHIVVFSHFAGAAIVEDRDDILVLREDEILAYREE
jgi:co-chaperonin GroES (HSP10)